MAQFRVAGERGRKEKGRKRNLIFFFAWELLGVGSRGATGGVERVEEARRGEERRGEALPVIS